jgi:alkaline phosphatase
VSTAALAALPREGSGFPVQFEGVRGTTHAHANVISRFLNDQLPFATTITVALDFVERNPDTLLIVTTDHGNANSALNTDPNRDP